jgi:hypothetical protein
MIEQLEARKAQVLAEIRSYPPPIPACDAQFNYLLEQRDQLSVALNRLHQLTGDEANLMQFAAELLT